MSFGRYRDLFVLAGKCVRHLGFCGKLEPGCVFGSGPLFTSYSSILVKIGHVIRHISWFVRLGGKMRPPSWILRKTENRMYSWVRTIVYKLQFKFGEDRTCHSADTGIRWFWRENASAILDFGETETRMYFLVRTIVYKLQFKFGEDWTCRSANIGICSFWRENASAILDFGQNWKLMFFWVRTIV